MKKKHVFSAMLAALLALGLALAGCPTGGGGSGGDDDDTSTKGDPTGLWENTSGTTVTINGVSFVFASNGNTLLKGTVQGSLLYPDGGDYYAPSYAVSPRAGGDGIGGSPVPPGDGGGEGGIPPATGSITGQGSISVSANILTVSGFKGNSQVYINGRYQKKVSNIPDPDTGPGLTITGITGEWQVYAFTYNPSSYTAIVSELTTTPGGVIGSGKTNVQWIRAPTNGTYTIVLLGANDTNGRYKKTNVTLPGSVDFNDFVELPFN
jgi:hypothetical protein